MMKSIPSFKRSRSAKSRSLLPSTVGPSTLRASKLPYSSEGSNSSYRGLINPIISFNGWNDGFIFDWYQDYRKARSTLIRKLQLRKERDNFKHEFIVIFMDNGLMHRVDRRPMGGANVDAIWAKGCEAEDTITLVTKGDLKIIESEADLEIEVEFNSQKPDLYTVIAVCVSIRMDPESGRYTLQRYNCYFMARTIIVITTRHYILEHSSNLSDQLRWDALTENSISTHIFEEDWAPLNKAMKNALITTLEKALLPIVRQDTETLVGKRKRLDELEKKTKAIIVETIVGETGDLAEASVKGGIIRWAIEVAQASLWYDDIEEHLSELSHADPYGNAAQSILTESVKAELVSNLPDRIGSILPKRLLNRLPPSLIAALPPELIARLPRHFLEKLPNEIILNTPPEFMARAPDEYFQNLPVTLYRRSINPVMLNLPDDLGRLPTEILDASLERMRMILDEPVNEDRMLALKLLKRLPEHILQRVPPKYRTMRDEEVVEDETEDAQLIAQMERIPGIRENQHPNKHPLNIIILKTPRRVYHYIPGFMAEVWPKSWYQFMSAEALEYLPPCYVSRFRASFLASMPEEVLQRVPASFLGSIPRETIEKLPDDFLPKLPVQLLRNIPEELLANLPENVSDLLRREIDEKVFDSVELKTELVECAAKILKGSLRQAPGIFFEPMIRVAVGTISRMKYKHLKTTRTHEDFQCHVLNMFRRHSKMVAQISHLGIGEDAVYDSLRQKTEVVWESMRPHATPPPTSSD